VYVRPRPRSRTGDAGRNALIARDPLGAYARDELGLSAALSARPLQAALASACSFSTGAAMPLLVVALASPAYLIPLVSGGLAAVLAFLGGLAAHVGAASVSRASPRHLLERPGHGRDRGNRRGWSAP